MKILPMMLVWLNLARAVDNVHCQPAGNLLKIGQSVPNLGLRAGPLWCAPLRRSAMSDRIG